MRKSSLTEKWTSEMLDIVVIAPWTAARQVRDEDAKVAIFGQ